MANVRPPAGADQLEGVHPAVRHRLGRVEEDLGSAVMRKPDDFTGGQLLNELSSKSGTITYSGLHTIDLNNGVVLTTGNDFYVYLSLSVGGQPYDCTSVVPVLSQQVRC